MRPNTDELAAWASILGAVVTLAGLLQLGNWLLIAGACCIAVSVLALAYGRRERTRLKSACINLEGHNLDSLNVANLRRRLNRTLFVQRAYQSATLDGESLIVSWQYDGYCRAEKETTIEFSIDSEANISFNELECFAYDLQQDPERRHKIRPLLIGNDGLSKKVAVPFLKAPLQDEPFSIVLNCKLPLPLRTGVIHYYASTLSFDQRGILRFAVHLKFLTKPPDWLRVYEADMAGRLNLINDLCPVKKDDETSEYLDLAEDVPGRSARIYVFQFSLPLHCNPGSLWTEPPSEISRSRFIALPKR